MLTNHPEKFQDSFTIETGISDFHKMTLVVLKIDFQKLPSSNIFVTKILMKILSGKKFVFYYTSKTFSERFNSVMKELDKSAPFKSKSVSLEIL